MATQADYTASANAILAVLRGIMAQYAAEYPDLGGWEEKAAQRLPPLAGQCAKASVDAVDAERANKEGSNMADPVKTTPVNILQEVLGFLQTACGMIASAAAIESLIAVLPAGTEAVAIANMVCQAVMAVGMKARPGAPTVVNVKGVTLQLHKSPA